MIIACACGAVIRGASEEGLLNAARCHIEREHPELGQPPSAADLLAMTTEEPPQSLNPDGALASHTQNDRRERPKC